MADGGTDEDADHQPQREPDDYGRAGAPIEESIRLHIER